MLRSTVAQPPTTHVVTTKHFTQDPRTNDLHYPRRQAKVPASCCVFRGDCEYPLGQVGWGTGVECWLDSLVGGLNGAARRGEAVNTKTNAVGGMGTGGVDLEGCGGVCVV